MFDRQTTVANLVLDHSETAQVFQRHRIDFCCKGDQSIAAVAEAKGIDTDALMAELLSAISARRGDAAPSVDLRELSTPRLCAHIVSKHHEYLRRTLPFVRPLAAKVSRVHGEHNPKLRDLDAAVGELTEALLPHLDQEEEDLFPALSSRAADKDTAKMLDSMHEEHLEVAKVLEQIRAASEDFTLPDWACNSYRTLFSELEQIEGDIFTHVHIENHVLRPRFTNP